jgi:amino acid adenylation domain-containing protein
LLDRFDGTSLRSAFLRQVSNVPDANAIVVGNTARTYADLHQTAGRWANAITSELGSRPERIGLFAYRSEVAYAGILTAMYAGATYVPLNPTFPPAKTISMISQADLDAVIVDAACLAQLEKVFPEDSELLLVTPEFERAQIPGRRKVLDRRALEGVAAGPLPPLTPEDTAYLLFTSGSTGAPKGVPVTHGNAVSFIEFMSARYGVGPDDRLSQTFDQTFDLSVFDMFMAWSNGACLYAMSPVDLLAPAKFVNRNQLTVWFSVPSVPVHMLRRKTLLPDSLPSLRWSLFCGEPLTQQSAAAWQKAAPNSVVENLYGPTELTIACCLHRWDPMRSPALCRNGIVPIGEPYPGLMTAVVDEGMNTLGPGQAGELCVAGRQTTPGYWRGAEITAQRFVSLPVSRHETRRFYRTGDLVERLPEGDYVFLGRADQQIKVLGHRVELGEIEAVLRKYPGVAHAVALPWPSAPASPDGVVAFVSGDVQDAGGIMALARMELPPYIVPRRVFVIPEMPFNANGKVDRGELRDRLPVEMAQSASIPSAREE